MTDISKDRLKTAATAHAPVLFKDSDPKLDEARSNAMDFMARAFMAAGLSVEGYGEQADPLTPSE